MERNATLFTISAFLVLVAVVVFILFIFADSRSSLFGTVTQTGSATDSVTLNRRIGVITTTSQNIAAGASVEFTFNNINSKLTSVVLVGSEYSGAGLPILTFRDVGEGSFKIKITNGGSVSLTSPVKIHFRIL